MATGSAKLSMSDTGRIEVTARCVAVVRAIALFVDVETVFAARHQAAHLTLDTHAMVERGEHHGAHGRVGRDGGGWHQVGYRAWLATTHAAARSKQNGSAK